MVDPTMVILVSAILVGVGVIALLIFLRFTQGSRHTALLENIERYEREQAQEDREAGEVLRGGPRGGAVAPIGPALAGAAANGGAQPRGGPSALAQATAQRLATLEERERQREEEERRRHEEEDDDEFDPIKTRIRQASQAIKRASGLLDAALREGYAEESRLDAVREGIRKERNRIRREGREEELDHLRGLSGFRELEEIQRYPEHRPERPVEETRRPAPTRPEPVQEAPSEEPEPAPAEEPVETDDTDAVLAEARRIAGETESEDEEENE